MRRRTKRARIVAVGNAPTPTAEQRMRMGPPPSEPSSDAHDVVGVTPCRVCGGPVEVIAEYIGVWRQHADCRALAVWPAGRLRHVAEVLGLGEVPTVEAVLLDDRHRVGLFEEHHPEPVYEGRAARPWGHVDRKVLAAALGTLPDLRVQAGIEVVPCAEGRCAWCGVEEASGWVVYGHRWADGGQAPLCGGCGAVYVRHSQPSPDFWADQREAISEAITGVALPLGYPAPAGLGAYAEWPVGDGSAWSHLPAEAVESWRWWCWTKWPSQAPPERRQEAQRRAGEQEAQRAVRAGQEAAAAAQSGDVFGFGVAR